MCKPGYLPTFLHPGIWSLEIITICGTLGYFRRLNIDTNFATSLSQAHKSTCPSHLTRPSSVQSSYRMGNDRLYVEVSAVSTAPAAALTSFFARSTTFPRPSNSFFLACGGVRVCNFLRSRVPDKKVPDRF